MIQYFTTQTQNSIPQLILYERIEAQLSLKNKTRFNVKYWQYKRHWLMRNYTTVITSNAKIPTKLGNNWEFSFNFLYINHCITQMSDYQLPREKRKYQQ